jgi:glycosyltransferase involved in cell wall biosynthesis
MKIGLFLSTSVFEDFYFRHMGITKQEYIDTYEDEWSFLYIKMLKQHNVDTTIYQFSEETKSVECHTHKPTGCEIKFIPTSMLYKVLPKNFLASYSSSISCDIIEQIKEDRPDTVFIQDYETGRYDVLAMVSKILQFGLVSQFHGAYPIKILKNIKMCTLRMADKLIAITKDEYRRLLVDYKLPSKKVAYLANPVDSHFFRPMEKDKAKDSIGLDKNKRYILFVGRLTNERKGLTYLIDAFCALSEKISNIELIIVGRGPDEIFLKNYARKRGAKNLNFVGWVSEREKLPYFYCASEFFVLPSIQEALPLVVLEAMACGLPVIGTDVGGIKDIIVNGQTGYLIPPNNSYAISEKMYQLLKNKELINRMSKKSRERILNHFSVDVIGDQLYSLLKDIHHKHI